MEEYNVISHKIDYGDSCNNEIDLMLDFRAEIKPVLPLIHDFKNIINIIKGNAQLSLRFLDKNSSVYKNLLQIEEATAQAGYLIHRLMGKGMQDGYCEICINDNILKAVQLFQYISSVGVQFECNLAKDIWQIKGDPCELDRVLINLMMNAVEAMKKPGIIRIVTENVSGDLNADKAVKNYIRISMEDTGEGMDEISLFEIFKPFHSSKMDGPSRGLGLAVVREFVKKMEGGIEVQSERGMGAKFTLRFPAHV